MDSIATRPATTAEAGARDAAGSVLVGLIGRGIQLSRTPAMHESEGRRLGLNYVYRLLDTELMGPNPPRLAELMNFAEMFGFAGVNVTHPYKQQVADLLDELAPEAEAVGSVNTVIFRAGRRTGHNTDLQGFQRGFQTDLEGAPRNSVILLGAGGAGAAVAEALLRSDVARLTVYDDDGPRCGALVERLTRRFGPDRAVQGSDLAAAGADADGIVNATPIGMPGTPGTAVPLDILHRRHWVADIVYFPLETELLRAARRLGCRTMSGESMAVFQAARAFELFTGIGPDVDRMRTSFAAWRGPAAA